MRMVGSRLSEKALRKLRDDIEGMEGVRGVHLNQVVSVFVVLEIGFWDSLRGRSGKIQRAVRDLCEQRYEDISFEVVA